MPTTTMLDATGPEIALKPLLPLLMDLSRPEFRAELEEATGRLKKSKPKYKKKKVRRRSY